MLYASSDQQVLGFLGRALSLELSVVQQYSTQVRLLTTWGLDQAGGRLQEECSEQMGHVDRIITRMLALGVAPGASQLRPVRLGRNLGEMLVQNQALEKELVSLYQQATAHCQRVADHDNRLFFETLLAEESSHEQGLGRWLQTLQHTGVATPQQVKRATF